MPGFAGVQAIRRAASKRMITRMIRYLAVFLVILGSGIATMGLVESDGVVAGFGVMLIVSGAFLIRG